MILLITVFLSTYNLQDVCEDNVEPWGRPQRYLLPLPYPPQVSPKSLVQAVPIEAHTRLAKTGNLSPTTSHPIIEPS